jgi:hypothetical protein
LKTSLTRLGYVALLVAATMFGSVFHVYGGSALTVFNGCLTPGGTLIKVSTETSPSCPGTTSAVSWNQQGPAGPPGPAGGLSQISEVTASKTFVVPTGVARLSVEAWGGGGGGSAEVQFPDCISSAGGGSGGYLRAIVSVMPGESLTITVGSGGAPGVAGGSSSVMRGSSILVSAGGGGGGTALSGPGAGTTGGAGGQVVSPGGIVRAGNPGANGTFDFMCAMGPGNPPTSPAGAAGAAIQGSVIPLNTGSAGGLGAIGFGVAAQSGGPGDVILTW